ncbi:hypothetical protein D3C85_599630 [compost metagenome]
MSKRGAPRLRATLSDIGDFLPDLGFEEQRFALGQARQAIVVFHHFGLDQFTLPFHFQGHPRRCSQRADVADFGGVVIGKLMARQRHFVRAEQHVVVFTQVQAVRITKEVIDEIAGRVFVDVTR